MRGLRLFLHICFYISLFSNNSCAKDLGKRGNSFEILEEGFLEMINRKLKTIDIMKINKKIIAIAKKKIMEPQAIKGITKTKETRSFIFDPTYIVTQDIKLPSGEIIVTRGTKVNPLEHMDFDRRLFFIDSRDKSQIIWLKKELKDNSELENKIILTGGSPISLREELETHIYFDQFGEITSKFGIKHVPAIVLQEGGSKVLRVEEVEC